MKGYKLSKEHDKHFEMIHPDGSRFPVAKSGLSEAHMAKIRKLADGGEVDDEQETGQELPNSFPIEGVPDPQPFVVPPETSWNPNMQIKPADKSVFPGSNYVAPETPAEANPNMQTFQKPEAETKSKRVNPNTVLPDETGMQKASYGDSADTGSAMRSLQSDNDRVIGEQVKAIQDSAKAAQTAANAQAKIYADQQKAMAELQTQHQQRYAAIDKEQEQLKQDVASTKIDPTRVWSNASTGNKILAGIGVLLSGIGSGLTGGPNLAMKVIDKTIDDDIAAQKSELGKKQNLLAENYRKYGDLNAATTATALHLNSITQSQIAAAAARASGPQAQANATMAMGQLQLRANEMKQQLAAMGLKRDILDKGAPAGLPPSVAENLFPGRTVNTPYGIKIAKTPEEAKDVSKAMTSLQTIESRLDTMLAFTKKTGTTAPFDMTAASAEGSSLKAEVIQELGELNSLTRLTGEEADLRSKYQVPDPGAWNTSKAQAQIATLKRFVTEKRNAIYANHLVGYNPGKATNRDVQVPGGGGVMTTSFGRP